MRKIIVPTDFSDKAKAAAITAAKIAKRMNARVQLVHVYETPVYNLPDLVLDPQTETKITNFIYKKLDELIRHPALSQVDIDYDIIRDTSVSDITQHAIAKDADLMVIGANGQRSGIGEHILGSNVDRIIRSAKCPVLTIKDENWDGELKNLVFTSLFDGHASTTFQSIKNFGEAFESRINLLYVHTPSSKFVSSNVIRSEMKQFAREWGLEDYTINEVNAHNYESGIFYFANQCKAEMIGLTTHIESKITHLFRGSLAEDLAHQAIRPVLTINTHSDITQSPLFDSVSPNGHLIQSSIY